MGQEGSGKLHKMQDRQGNLLRWKKTLDPGLEDVTCRKCGEAEETGAHMALVCFENEGLGRRFGSWEQAKRWRKKVQKKDRVEINDLAESFAQLGDI